MKKMFALILCLSLLTSGCSAIIGAAAGGAVTAAWFAQRLSDVVSVRYERAIKATKDGLRALNMQVERETHGRRDAQIISRYVDGRKVWIDIHYLSEKSTEIQIRVGALGDKTASTKILDSIKRHL
jgi:hypothetical protein